MQRTLLIPLDKLNGWLFGVSAADNSISSAEDTTIRTIADELHLDHSEFIAVKSAYGSLLATRNRADETDPRR